MPCLRLYLAHHGDAVGPGVDIRRPLSDMGRVDTERVAAVAAARGAKPIVIWHSGKLRAKQTAEIFWRACNPLAEFSATRDLQPEDSPGWIADRLRFETRDILIAGHYPHLPRLLMLLASQSDGAVGTFPLNGVVALSTADDGQTWTEDWRVESSLGGHAR
jgi:phosphohistidine phosphatase